MRSPFARAEPTRRPDRPLAPPDPLQAEPELRSLRRGLQRQRDRLWLRRAVRRAWWALAAVLLAEVVLLAVARIVPVEMSVVVVGFERNGIMHHQLPPRPPLSLDLAYVCDQGDLRRFTSAGRFGYFRHLLRMPELPLGELLAAHIQRARRTQPDPAGWNAAAVQELIVLLRDDYVLLTSVLGALNQLQGVDSTDERDG